MKPCSLPKSWPSSYCPTSLERVRLRGIVSTASILKRPTKKRESFNVLPIVTLSSYFSLLDSYLFVFVVYTLVRWFVSRNNGSLRIPDARRRTVLVSTSRIAMKSLRKYICFFFSRCYSVVASTYCRLSIADAF